MGQSASNTAEEREASPAEAEKPASSVVVTPPKDDPSRVSFDTSAAVPAEGQFTASGTYIDAKSYIASDRDGAGAMSLKSAPRLKDWLKIIQKDDDFGAVTMEQLKRVKVRVLEKRRDRTNQILRRSCTTLSKTEQRSLSTILF